MTSIFNATKATVIAAQDERTGSKFNLRIKPNAKKETFAVALKQQGGERVTFNVVAEGKAFWAGSDKSGWLKARTPERVLLRALKVIGGVPNRLAKEMILA